MVTKYVHRRSDVLQGYRQLRLSIGGVMVAFGDLQDAAMADGLVTAKHKSLIAVGIAVAGQCEGSISLAVHDAVKAGVNRQEMEEAVGVAIAMGGRSAAVGATAAMDALDQFLADRGRSGLDLRVGDDTTS